MNYSVKSIFCRLSGNPVIIWAHTNERNVISRIHNMVRLKWVVWGHIFSISALMLRSRKLELYTISSLRNIHERNSLWGVFFPIFLLFCFSCSWASGTSSFWADPITKTSGFSWRPLAVSVYCNICWQYHPSTLVPRWSPDRNRWREWHICGGQHHSWLLLNYTVTYAPCNSRTCRQVLNRCNTCNKLIKTCIGSCFIWSNSIPCLNWNTHRYRSLMAMNGGAAKSYFLCLSIQIWATMDLKQIKTVSYAVNHEKKLNLE